MRLRKAHRNRQNRKAYICGIDFPTDPCWPRQYIAWNGQVHGLGFTAKQAIRDCLTAYREWLTFDVCSKCDRRDCNGHTMC